MAVGPTVVGVTGVFVTVGVAVAVGPLTMTVMKVAGEVLDEAAVTVISEKVPPGWPTGTLI